jgi:pimeloyl-ACP methyl ester carboxylesterase
MGCRVVIEAALQAPDRVAGVVLVDGSQFAVAMSDVFRAAFASPDGFTTLTERMFRDMFTARSDAATATSIVERALHTPREIGEKMLLDLTRYDANRLATSLAELRVPFLAIQATYANEKRERRSLSKGQTTPFLDMLRSRVPSLRIEIIADSGHFPQIDEPAQVNALLQAFLAELPIR